MKKVILILAGLAFTFIVGAQSYPIHKSLGHITLQNDTMSIIYSDNVYSLSVYVDDSSTDSCEVAGRITTIGGVATDTIVIPPGVNYSTPPQIDRVLDSLSVISRSGCKALIQLFYKP